MSQPELKPEEIIIQLKAENSQLKIHITELEKENASLKTRLNIYESQGKNYVSPTTVRTGFK